SLGTRYVSLRQDWHATVRGGPELATSEATQTFAGLGLTAGLASDHPVGRNWGIYTTNKWTLLLGQNNRKSTSAGSDVGGPFTNTLVENKTTLFPAGELDVGVRYLAPLDGRRASADPGPMLSIRV